MTHFTFLRRPRTSVAVLAAASVALLVAPTVTPTAANAAANTAANAAANASGSGHGKPPQTPGIQVSVAADSAGLNIATGQCGGAPITVRLTNPGTQAVYADATLSAARPLALQRTVISTYLPAGYTAQVPIPVTAPLGTEPGSYSVKVSAGKSTANASVNVTATAPDPNGDLARSASKISASSTHAGYPVCGAVDGDTDGAHWGTTTGWNDGNSTIWPDWFELRWDGPQTVGRVTLHTLNSTKYPAARYGLKDWDVQTFSDGQWKTVASVRGNTQGVVDTTFEPVRTTDLRVLLLAGNGANDYSRIVELEAFAS
ncbi:discoidin domain-containing protein [Nonomuraea jiangxiensis]|uniref:F5/8 type C domain-containing protein n=1 Tax=Nonomuraea jiangxiensis TaxID=633440 RepID=A0A1G8MI14_9ACTN|nr:discoidin domain-containing protein [Nonomuraea jiangxiensis]SDI67566.1 F5/8 type C domain-containing protein [Nonomuraea jiangxiensis]